MSRNDELFARAQRTIPAGVNSPVRAFRSVGGTPRFFVRGEGAYLWDADQKRYIDYVGSWGPAILGHAHPEVVRAVQEAARNGLSFGAPTQAEVEMAETLCSLLPSVELVRLVSSGTEATMSALRLARGHTGRSKIVKFEGCYHGHGDSLLVKAGSGVATLGLPDSPGVTKGTAVDTLNAKYNDIESVKELVDKNKGLIAAIIIEPVAGNMGCVQADKEFLKELREITKYERIVLIFDEVMSGFRVARGGAQELYGIKPDLSCFGKIIGGGLPVGAYGGKREIMNKVAPSGPVYQAGTLSGNPLAMRAGYETLRLISEDREFYTKLNQKAEYLYEGIKDNLRDIGLNYQLNSCGSMFTLFFTDKKITDYDSAKTSETKKFSKYFNSMLQNGIYLPPSQFEACFVSAAHSIDDIESTIKANYTCLKSLL